MVLSASASTVLSYARARAVGRFAEIGDDIGLPDRIVISACKELQAAGIISGFEVSEDSVECVELK